MSNAVLIPAYNPTFTLIELLKSLREKDKNSSFVIIDDGSEESTKEIFEQVSSVSNTILLRHDQNKGKGAAIKTGVEYIVENLTECDRITTADADGQHHPDDIIRVTNAEGVDDKDIVLGSRSFDQNIPLRSLIGNRLTCIIMRVIFGLKIRDTQTGLRSFRREFVEHLLNITYNRYEFEMEMFLTAKRNNYNFVEIPIKTIYLNNNESSHFNPIFDSLKIYAVLFRYSIASLLTSIVDYSFFVAASYFVNNILLNTYISRLFALVINYVLVKNLVFKSKEHDSKSLPKYLILVLISGYLSSVSIEFLMANLEIGLLTSKLLAESCIFSINFLVQKNLIFNRSTKENSKAAKTDWDSYYAKPYKTSSFTRRVTENKLKSLFNEYLKIDSRLSIAEFGGGNSCFFQSFRSYLNPAKYYILDNNKLGLEKFAQRVGQSEVVITNHIDVINPSGQLPRELDLVYSVGLIEHFDKTETALCIKSHFDSVKSGGFVVLTFPTPTMLYRSIRLAAEKLGIWIFHDERPLTIEEVKQVCQKFGSVQHYSITWLTLLTQGVIVVEKT